jgi:hypothetical protein
MPDDVSLIFIVHADYNYTPDDATPISTVFCHARDARYATRSH